MGKSAGIFRMYKLVTELPYAFREIVAARFFARLAEAIRPIEDSRRIR